MNRIVRNALCSIAVVAATIFATSPVEAQAQNVQRLESRLQTTAPLQAKARFEARPNGRRKFTTEVSRLAQGSQVRVFVRRGTNQHFMGTAVANAAGIADLNLDTGNGHAVPALQAGDTVFVLRSGQTIATGQLMRR